LAPAITTILGGNPVQSLGIKLRLQLFYLLVYLQGRTGKLVNKLSLRPDATASELNKPAAVRQTSIAGQSSG
jgi:hypothetical protein